MRKTIFSVLFIIFILYYIKINYKNYYFDKYGYLKVENVLSKDECNLLWKEIMYKWKKNNMEAYRSNILTNIGKRKDLLMDFLTELIDI